MIIENNFGEKDNDFYGVKKNMHLLMHLERCTEGN
jgi:hypothetical protein